MDLRRAVCTVALMVLIAAMSTGGGAEAQTTGVGPYYAWPSWDQKLPPSTRFIVLSNWNSEAVLDRETGLVWDRSPVGVAGFTWDNAQFHCNTSFKGGRNGWRLPAIQELTSLMDQSVTPTLPTGHPFVVNTTYIYWAGTNKAPDGAAAWLVFFGNGAINYALKTQSTGFSVWCVRGGQGVNPQ